MRAVPKRIGLFRADRNHERRRSRGQRIPFGWSAREYVESVTRPFNIPQNWIVDKAGTLREKSVGFDSRMADWPEHRAEKTLEVVPKPDDVSGLPP